MQDKIIVSILFLIIISFLGTHSPGMIKHLRKTQQSLVFTFAILFAQDSHKQIRNKELVKAAQKLIGNISSFPFLNKTFFQLQLFKIYSPIIMEAI